MVTKDRDIAVTVSIGVAVVGENSTVDTILATADAALYQAKDKGRNRVVWSECLARHSTMSSSVSNGCGVPERE
jgi:predicted signal transduction protein with EAL and GGDEF domain